MSLKNYTTKAPVPNMLSEIQKSLLRVRALGINYRFNDQGKIVGLSFILNIKGNDVSFLLPIRVDKIKVVLERDGNIRCNDDEYVYRVAWANMRDWVTAQMAMIETEMAEPLQVFLPYAMDKKGLTLYDSINNNPNFFIE